MQMNKNILVIFVSSVILLIASCNTRKDSENELSKWVDSDAKAAVLTYLSEITNENSEQFIPIKHRIAVFDNDGTLWCEKPLYPHFYSLFAKVEMKISENDSLKTVEPYKSLHSFIQSKDPHQLSYFMEELEEGKYLEIVGQLMGEPFSGMTIKEFEKEVGDFYATWKHPELNTRIDSITYLPMKELIDLLQKNHFQCYIFTADEGAFLKLFSQELYNIPPENVQGSDVLLSYTNGVLTRSNKGLYLNNWDGKPRKIQQIIGKQPVFAAGNSNGDFHMLQYVNEHPDYNTISMLIHHTDSVREFKYDTHLDQVMPYAKRNNYIIVDMAKDWKVVFH